MTIFSVRAAGHQPALLGARPYWVATAPFLVIFVTSVLVTFSDLEATRVATEGFGFPAWAVLPQGVAKVLGLVAILSRWSQFLTGLAFAGFFYDVLLALGTHIAQQDPPNIALATAGLLSIAAAYWADQRRYPPVASH